MLNSLRSLGRRGDTIIEVMMVLAVLGLALGISYATANRSLLNIRQAQENSEASELATNQIEALRVFIPGTDLTNNVYSNPFCLAPGVTSPYQAEPEVTAPNGACVSSFFDIPSSTVTDYYCGGPSGGGNSGSICSGLAGEDTFVVQVVWPDVAGQGTDTVTQVYRVHS